MQKKYNLNYFTDTPITDILANQIAKIEMVKAFSILETINSCYFYFISNTLKISKEVKTKFNGRVVLRPIFIPFYKISLKNLFSFFYRIIVGNRLVSIRFFLLFTFKKFNANDIVFIRGGKFVFVCWLVNLFKNINYIFEVHNYEYGKNRLKDILYKKIMQKAKLIVTISEYTKRGWEKAGINSDKIIVLPSGVNIKLFDSINESKNSLRNKLNIDPKKSVLCYVGSLYRHRGIEDILFAANKMQNNIFILIGGNTKDINYYKSHISEKYGSLNNAFLLGWMEQSKAVEYIKCSDLLLAPYSAKCSTIDHMSPVKLFEYMASKVPIIVSDFPRIRDLVSSDDVIFAKPDDSLDLYKKIESVLKNYQESKKKALSAYNKVLSWSWDERAKKVLKSLGLFL